MSKTNQSICRLCHGAFIGAVSIAYIPQIICKSTGSKGSTFSVLFAAVSCLIWVICKFGLA